MDLSKISALFTELNEQIIGKEEVIQKTLICLLAQGHVLFEDSPGTGKTTLVKAIAQLIDCKFSRMQGTADLMPTDLLGGAIFEPAEHKLIFSKGPIFADFFLFDEINRAPSRVQSALLECMEERTVSTDQGVFTLGNAFTVFATMNNIDSAGTYILPEAQMDRFLMKLSFGHPSKEAEKQILHKKINKEDKLALKPVLTLKDLEEIRKHVRSIHVSETACEYIVALVDATRKSNQLLWGASTRASLALAHCAQAVAYLDGREFVKESDVQYVAQDVLVHRVKSHQQNPHTVIAQIINQIKVKS